MAATSNRETSALVSVETYGLPGGTLWCKRPSVMSNPTQRSSPPSSVALSLLCYNPGSDGLPNKNMQFKTVLQEADAPETSQPFF